MKRVENCHFADFTSHMASCHVPITWYKMAVFQGT